MAAYTTPRIIVKNPNEKPGAGGVLTVRVEQTKEDDATFRLVIYIPKGYTMTLIPQEGQTLGTVVAQAQANAISPDAVIELTGTIQAEAYSPTTFPQGATCAGTPAIQSVFVLVLAAAGQTLRVPLYAAAAEGPETSFAQAKLIACLPSPYIPPEQGGATFGAKLIDAVLTFPSAFTSPAQSDGYVWRALFTPYTVGSAAPNLAGTVESQSIDLPGTSLTMTTTVNRRTRRVTYAGRLGNANAVFTGSRVQIRQGTRVIGTVRTNNQGRYRFQSRALRPGRYAFSARGTVNTIEQQCDTPTNPAVRCLAVTIGGFTITSRTVRVTIRRSGR